MTNEIVRQLLEQGGMYSPEKPIGDMRYIVDTRSAPTITFLDGVYLGMEGALFANCPLISSAICIALMTLSILLLLTSHNG